MTDSVQEELQKHEDYVGTEFRFSTISCHLPSKGLIAQPHISNQSYRPYKFVVTQQADQLAHYRWIWASQGEIREDILQNHFERRADLQWESAALCSHNRHMFGKFSIMQIKASGSEVWQCLETSLHEL
jgi:hypothetical protein